MHHADPTSPDRSPETSSGGEKAPFDIKSIRRPAPQLMTYYLLVSIASTIGIFITLPLFWFRYLTLEYVFDDEGVAMRYGILFRRETQLTYRRIQDIHLTRNLLQRWLGLATVSIQTAAASAMPEIQIEGVLQAEELRDFLYQQMRGAKGQEDHTGADQVAALEAADGDEATELLKSIRDNLAKLVVSKESNV